MILSRVKDMEEGACCVSIVFTHNLQFKTLNQISNITAGTKLE